MPLVRTDFCYSFQFVLSRENLLALRCKCLHACVFDLVRTLIGLTLKRVSFRTLVQFPIYTVEGKIISY